MSDVKINASFVLPGGTLRAELPLLKKGKKGKKEEKEEEGLYRQETIRLVKEKPIVISLREPKPAQQVLHLSYEAYNFMISDDGRLPGITQFEWKRLSNNKKVKIHLMNIAESLGGKLESFAILED